MIRTGKKFSKPDLSRVINGDTVLSDNDKRMPRRRLDHILVEQHPEYNRSTLQNFIKSGYVSIEGKVYTKPNTEIEAVKPVENTEKPEQSTNNDQILSKNYLWPEISLNVPEKETPPEVKNLTIYEDENVLVINKPEGLLSMAKGEFTTEPTLEDYGLLVHRLDRDTSGVVILAKNPAVQSFLRKQFQDRKTHKTYYALVEGRPKLDEAKIDLPIERSIKSPTTFIVSPSGKPSQTFYKVIDSKEIEIKGKIKTISLVELKPITGRTHQLRVHLKYLGHPIIGDRVYGETPASRLYLHAKSLEITIPGKKEGKRVTFEAELPEDFKNITPNFNKAD